MTIEKGLAWGRVSPLPADGVLARDDHSISAALEDARRRQAARPSFGLVGGDLARTCGATGDEDRLRGPDAQTLPVDLGEVLVDGVLHYFVAHLVARRSWWRGPVVAVMNAQHLGTWDVAPRAHPNDGRLDVLRADLGIGDRWKAWRRLPTGSHVPHPGIEQRRVKALQVDLAPGTKVWLDGTCVGPARALSIRAEPDAFEVTV